MEKLSFISVEEAQFHTYDYNGLRFVRYELGSDYHWIDLSSYELLAWNSKVYFLDGTELTGKEVVAILEKFHRNESDAL